MSINFLTPRDFIGKKYLSATKLDVIIFGATGKTGRHTVMEAVEVLSDYSWGIAGRDRDKLESLLREMSRRTKRNLYKIPIFIADVEDPHSLADMVMRCHVVVNCCGPYQELGEPVVRACIDAGTHYVDLSMEAPFNERIELDYHEDARSQNVYIISACGWESLPTEIGINYLQENFNGTINYIESYMECWNEDNYVVMPLGSKGAWTSIVLSCANYGNMPAIREKLHSELPDLKPKTNYRGLVHESDLVPGVSVPFPVKDTQVVERSQYYFYEQEQRRPIQFKNYMTFSSYVVAITFFLWCGVIGFLAQIPFTRELLLKYPSLFSCGLFSEEGPSQKVLDNTHFKITLHAVGWSRTSKKPNYDFQEAPNKSMTMAISGSNPLYGVSCVCLLASAITIIEESARMPENGGVYSPGAAFANTNITNVLQSYEHGLNFEYVDDQ